MKPELFKFLEDNGYTDCRILSDGRVACISTYIFTSGIICATPEQMWEIYEDRWCYHTLDMARKALARWDGKGEPEGWHRHLPSGRRRDDGDALKEYINP